MSTVRLSHPACAITSAEKELGTCNHPLTTVLPSRQILFRRFSLILVSPLGRLHASRSLAPLSLRSGLPRRAAPVAKFEDFVIESVTQIRRWIRGDPNVAYRPADPRQGDYATIAEQIIQKPVDGEGLGCAACRGQHVSVRVPREALEP